MDYSLLAGPTWQKRRPFANKLKANESPHARIDETKSRGEIPRPRRSARGAPVKATGVQNARTNRAARPDASQFGANENTGPLCSG